MDTPCYWSFSKKKLSKNFDFVFSKRNNNFYYLYNSFLKTKKIKVQRHKKNIFQFQEYKVLKFFFISSIFQNFVLYFRPSKFFNKYNWISIKQATSILVNRQAGFNLQISKLWLLSKRNIFQTYPACVYNCNSLNKIPSDNFNLFIEQVYNISLSIKPILINPNLFTKFYNKKFYSNCYIIQSFLIFFYYEYFLNLKFDSYFFNSFNKNCKKIGFQTQFKILTIPIFLVNKNKNNKNPSQLKKDFFKNEVFMLLRKFDSLNKTSKKQQNTLNWPCTCREKNFIDKIGYCLNFGLGVKQNIYFDRNRVILDIIYNRAFCKFDLLTFFSYRNFQKLKIRFFAHRLLSKNLIVFQKIENHIDPKYYYSRILNLNNDYKNQEYYNSLLLNFIKTYFTNFNRNLIKKNRPFYSFDLDNNLTFLFSEKIFLKMGFAQALRIKTKNVFNLEYPILLKTYSPLRKNEIKAFNFYRPNIRKNNINYDVFNNLASFSLKIFCLNSIQKLNVQSFLNKKINTTKILYKRFKHCLIRDLVYINFSSSLLNGEIVYTDSKKQELEKNFIILTQSNLKSFKVESHSNKIRSKILMLNNFLRYGTIFENQKIVSLGGLVIYIDKKAFTIREAIPFLITSRSLINVHQDESIKQGSRLFTFLSYQVKTGDIIQGIPKIEEFFEARLTRDGLPILTNLHTQIKQFFQTYKSKFSIFEATQKSFEKNSIFNYQ